MDGHRDGLLQGGGAGCLCAQGIHIECHVGAVVADTQAFHRRGPLTAPWDACVGAPGRVVALEWRQALAPDSARLRVWSQDQMVRVNFEP